MERVAAAIPAVLRVGDIVLLQQSAPHFAMNVMNRVRCAARAGVLSVIVAAGATGCYDTLGPPAIVTQEGRASFAYGTPSLESGERLPCADNYGAGPGVLVMRDAGKLDSLCTSLETGFPATPARFRLRDTLKYTEDAGNGGADPGTYVKYIVHLEQRYKPSASQPSEIAVLHLWQPTTAKANGVTPETRVAEYFPLISQDLSGMVISVVQFSCLSGATSFRDCLSPANYLGFHSELSLCIGNIAAATAWNGADLCANVQWNPEELTIEEIRAATKYVRSDFAESGYTRLECLYWSSGWESICGEHQVCQILDGSVSLRTDGSPDSETVPALNYSWSVDGDLVSSSRSMELCWAAASHSVTLRVTDPATSSTDVRTRLLAEP